MITKYISVKSVLYNVSLLLDDRYWNEAKILEWIVRGLRQSGITQQYITQSAILDLVDHKAALPADLKRITHVAYAYVTSPISDDADIAALDLPETSMLAGKLNSVHNPLLWRPMGNSSLATDLVCIDPRFRVNSCCGHSFSVTSSLMLTSTLPTGPILVTYLAHPIDEEGYPLMPDDEDLKEALLHYVLYNYWMSKYTMKEEGADQRLKFHLGMWQTLSMKAKNLNLPDINMLERMRVERNTLNPKTNHYSELFLNLGGQ